MPREKATNKAGNGTKKKTTRRKATVSAKSGGNGDSKKKTPRKRSASTRGADDIVISEDERRRLIAEAAYLRAEARGFVGGDPTDDWLAAEHEVDARIAAQA